MSNIPRDPTKYNCCFCSCAQATRGPDSICVFCSGKYDKKPAILKPKDRRNIAPCSQQALAPIPLLSGSTTVALTISHPSRHPKICSEMGSSSSQPEVPPPTTPVRQIGTFGDISKRSLTPWKNRTSASKKSTSTQEPPVTPIRLPPTFKVESKPEDWQAVASRMEMERTSKHDVQRLLVENSPTASIQQATTSEVIDKSTQPTQKLCTTASEEGTSSMGITDGLFSETAPISEGEKAVLARDEFRLVEITHRPKTAKKRVPNPQAPHSTPESPVISPEVETVKSNTPTRAAPSVPVSQTTATVFEGRRRILIPHSRQRSRSSSIPQLSTPTSEHSTEPDDFSTLLPGKMASTTIEQPTKLQQTLPSTALASAPKFESQMLKKNIDRAILNASSKRIAAQHPVASTAFSDFTASANAYEHAAPVYRYRSKEDSLITNIPVPVPGHIPIHHVQQKAYMIADGQIVPVGTPKTTSSSTTQPPQLLSSPTVANEFKEALSRKIRNAATNTHVSVNHVPSYIPQVVTATKPMTTGRWAIADKQQRTPVTRAGVVGDHIIHVERVDGREATEQDSEIVKAALHEMQLQAAQTGVQPPTSGSLVAPAQNSIISGSGDITAVLSFGPTVPDYFPKGLNGTVGNSHYVVLDGVSTTSSIPKLVPQTSQNTHATLSHGEMMTHLTANPPLPSTVEQPLGSPFIAPPKTAPSTKSPVTAALQGKLGDTDPLKPTTPPETEPGIALTAPPPSAPLAEKLAYHLALSALPPSPPNLYLALLSIAHGRAPLTTLLQFHSLKPFPSPETRSLGQLVWLESFKPRPKDEVSKTMKLGMGMGMSEGTKRWMKKGIMRRVNIASLVDTSGKSEWCRLEMLEYLMIEVGRDARALGSWVKGLKAFPPAVPYVPYSEEKEKRRKKKGGK